MQLCLQVLALSRNGRQLRIAAEALRLGHWTMAARLLPLPPPPSPPPQQRSTLSRRTPSGGSDGSSGGGGTLEDAAVALAVGLSDNSVMIYCLLWSHAAAQAQVRTRAVFPPRFILAVVMPAQSTHHERPILSCSIGTTRNRIRRNQRYVLRSKQSSTRQPRSGLFHECTTVIGTSFLAQEQYQRHTEHALTVPMLSRPGSHCYHTQTAMVSSLISNADVGAATSGARGLCQLSASVFHGSVLGRPSRSISPSPGCNRHHCPRWSRSQRI